MSRYTYIVECSYSYVTVFEGEKLPENIVSLKRNKLWPLKIWEYDNQTGKQFFVRYAM